MAIMAAGCLATAARWAQAAVPWVVAIDAGHTLLAPGARAAGDGRSELSFNQDLAGLIALELSAMGARVRLANEPPRAREDFARRAGAGVGASLFLSVHHDSAKESQLDPVDGPEGRRWEDRRERFKGFSLFVDPSDAHGVVCARMVGRRLRLSGERPSLYHASADLGESRLLLDAENGVHAFPGLALSRLRKAPMVLLEAGVIVGASESARLRDPAIVGILAHAVAQGALDCSRSKGAG